MKISPRFAAIVVANTVVGLACAGATETEEFSSSMFVRSSTVTESDAGVGDACKVCICTYGPDESQHCRSWMDRQSDCTEKIIVPRGDSTQTVGCGNIVLQDFGHGQGCEASIRSVMQSLPLDAACLGDVSVTACFEGCSTFSDIQRAETCLQGCYANLPPEVSLCLSVTGNQAWTFSNTPPGTDGGSYVTLTCGPDGVDVEVTPAPCNNGICALPGQSAECTDSDGSPATMLCCPSGTSVGQTFVTIPTDEPHVCPENPCSSVTGTTCFGSGGTQSPPTCVYAGYGFSETRELSCCRGTADAEFGRWGTWQLGTCAPPPPPPPPPPPRPTFSECAAFDNDSDGCARIGCRFESYENAGNQEVTSCVPPAN